MQCDDALLEHCTSLKNQGRNEKVEKRLEKQKYGKTIRENHSKGRENKVIVWKQVDYSICHYTTVGTHAILLLALNYGHVISQ